MSAIVLTVLAAIASAPPSATSMSTSSILILDVRSTSPEIDAGGARLLSNLLTASVARHVEQRATPTATIKVLSQSDIRRAVELEADRAAAGCDSSACLAELANAMGVDLVVFAEVGKLGSSMLMTLSLFDARRGEVITRDTIEGADVDRMRALLDSSVDRLLTPLAPTTPTSPLLVTGAVMSGAGSIVAGVGAGAALYMDAQLGDAAVGSADKKTAYESEPWLLAIGGMGAAVALVGVALIGVDAMLGSAAGDAP